MKDLKLSEKKNCFVFDNYQILKKSYLKVQLGVVPHQSRLVLKNIFLSLVAFVEMFLDNLLHIYTTVIFSAVHYNYALKISDIGYLTHFVG